MQPDKDTVEISKVAELLKPRYKVIADYPDAILTIGQVINTYENGVAYLTETSKGSMADYPHLFKKLEWWEDRKPKQMPVFVKNMSNVPEVRKVIEYRMDRLYEVAVSMDKSFGGYDREYLFLNDTSPATEQDYLTYINQTKNEK